MSQFLTDDLRVQVVRVQTGTGTVSLNRDTIVAANKNFLMASGTGQFTSGTGAVTLNGLTALKADTTLSNGKAFIFFRTMAEHQKI